MIGDLGKQGWLQTGTLALLFVTLVASSGCGKISDKPVTSDLKTATAKARPKVPTEFDVPDGTPEELLEYVGKLEKYRPRLTTQEQVNVYRRNYNQAILGAAEKILAQNAEDKQLIEAANMKIATVIRTAIDPANSPQQRALLSKAALSLVQQMCQDERTPVSQVAYLLLMTARMINLPTMSATERSQLATDAIELVSSTKRSPQAVRDVDQMAKQFVQIGDLEQAAAMYEKLADRLENPPTPALADFIEMTRGKARRLRLPGQPLELEGTFLDGSQLDWNSYRGKVVLVDFWATWCGPCVAELPNVKACYDKYHSRGFEVIGISSDDDRAKLEKFIDQQKLPWGQIFSEPDPEKPSRPGPMSMKYGVEAIPCALLVDRDGKVVSIEAQGEELQEQLRKLFGGRLK